ncbi:hypothetical protein L6452_38775 [Arctium lappa]|uniref:Uncharacterized protein n=1 Tax=Arctium lappa TaxID=4217 RepID=A0ACB8XUK9_ARCLA|nr:hypothetical protein L6452_38775 [Arctium lappa]
MEIRRGVHGFGNVEPSINENTKYMVGPNRSTLNEIHSKQKTVGVSSQREVVIGTQSNYSEQQPKGKEAVKEDRGKEGERSKLKKGENMGMGRGRMSFHVLKQKARRISQRGGQRRAEPIKGAKVKKARGIRVESEEQVSASNEVSSTDRNETMEEFGRKVGLIWEVENDAGNQGTGH